MKDFFFPARKKLQQAKEINLILVHDLFLEKPGGKESALASSLVIFFKSLKEKTVFQSYQHSFMLKALQSDS